MDNGRLEVLSGSNGAALTSPTISPPGLGADRTQKRAVRFTVVCDGSVCAVDARVRVATRLRALPLLLVILVHAVLWPAAHLLASHHELPSRARV